MQYGLRSCAKSLRTILKCFFLLQKVACHGICPCRYERSDECYPNHLEPVCGMNGKDYINQHAAACDKTVGELQANF